MTIRSENTRKQTIADTTLNSMVEYLKLAINSFPLPMSFEKIISLKQSDITNMVDILSKSTEFWKA